MYFVFWFLVITMFSIEVYISKNRQRKKENKQLKRENRKLKVNDKKYQDLQALHF